MLFNIVCVTLVCTPILAVDTSTAAPTTTGGATGTGTTVAVTGSTVSGTNRQTTLAGCADVEPDCAKYASTLCVRPAYAQVMFTQCKKTCGMCNGNNVPPCQDAHENCASWSNLNYCASTFYSTAAKKANCAKTCGMCDSAVASPTAANCVDKNNNCVKWNKNGYCASTAYTEENKRTNCAKTCNKCKP